MDKKSNILERILEGFWRISLAILILVTVYAFGFVSGETYYRSKQEPCDCHTQEVIYTLELAKRQLDVYKQLLSIRRDLYSKEPMFINHIEGGIGGGEE
jgi:hypothetical protein